jgi:hypothetical protein
MLEPRPLDAMAATPEPLAGSAQLQSLPAALLQALHPLLERAPAGLFPRARRLYFDKYPLEGHPKELDRDPAAPRFRTFVLRETLYQPLADQPGQSELPGQSGVVPVSPKLHELAVVHWQKPRQPPLTAIAGYLRRRWQLQPAQLEAMTDTWFRDGGAWVRVTLPGADPAPVEADPDTTP